MAARMQSPTRRTGTLRDKSGTGRHGDTATRPKKRKRARTLRLTNAMTRRGGERNGVPSAHRVGAEELLQLAAAMSRRSGSLGSTCLLHVHMPQNDSPSLTFFLSEKMIPI
jgi:hypothetical protein